jgi:hypothetical protein
VPRYEATKEQATKFVLAKANSLNRPLMVKDFKYPKDNEIGLGVIKKYWGTFNAMLEELNLPITQIGRSTLHKPEQQMIDEYLMLVDELGRVPTVEELDACQYTSSVSNYYYNFGRYNDFVISLGLNPFKRSISNGLSNDDIKSNIYASKTNHFVVDEDKSNTITVINTGNIDNTVTNNNKQTETYTRITEGATAGFHATTAIKQIRDIIINIDMEIVNDLEELFINLR